MYEALRTRADVIRPRPFTLIHLKVGPVLAVCPQVNCAPNAGAGNDAVTVSTLGATHSLLD